MKAVQIDGYSKQIHTVLHVVPQPRISDSDMLIQVRAAVNPLELLILIGNVKLIQNYAMPLTLGNECSGIVEQVGSKVTGFCGYPADRIDSLSGHGGRIGGKAGGKPC